MERTQSLCAVEGLCQDGVCASITNRVASASAGLFFKLSDDILDYVIRVFLDPCSSLQQFRTLMNVSFFRRCMESKCSTDVQLLRFLRQNPVPLPFAARDEYAPPPILNTRTVFCAIAFLGFRLCDVCGKVVTDPPEFLALRDSIPGLFLFMHSVCAKVVLKKVKLKIMAHYPPAVPLLPEDVLARAAAPVTPDWQWVFRGYPYWVPRGWNSLWTFYGAVAAVVRDSPTELHAAIEKAAHMAERRLAHAAEISSLMLAEVEANWNAVQAARERATQLRTDRFAEARRRAKPIVESIVEELLGPGATTCDLYARLKVFRDDAQTMVVPISMLPMWRQEVYFSIASSMPFFAKVTDAKFLMNWVGWNVWRIDELLPRALKDMVNNVAREIWMFALFKVMTEKVSGKVQNSHRRFEWNLSWTSQIMNHKYPGIFERCSNVVRQAVAEIKDAGRPYLLSYSELKKILEPRAILLAAEAIAIAPEGA
jgi:hypothetical protein